MSRKLKIFGALAIIPLFAIFSVTTIYARAIAEEGPIAIAEDEVYDEDLFLGADVITIAGTVNGDVYAAGGVITVTGTINGDIIAAGGNVDISGTIRDDLRAWGGVVNVRSASVGDNLTLVGGRVYMAKDVSVEGSVVLGGGKVINESTVNRELFAGAGELTLNGTVENTVSVGAGTITLGPDTNLKQDFVYNSDSNINKDEKALIGGETRTYNAHVGATFENRPMQDRIAWDMNIGMRLWSYLSALVVGLLILYFFRLPAKNVVTTMVKRPWGTVGWGLGVLILTMPVLVLLMVTFVGLPLALILMVIFFISLYLAKIFIGLLIGTYISQYMDNKQPNAYVSFALGLFVYYILTIIPGVHFIVGLLSSIFALGALFINARRRLFFERN